MQVMEIIIIFESFGLDLDPNANTDPKLTARRIRIRNKQFRTRKTLEQSTLTLLQLRGSD